MPYNFRFMNFRLSIKFRKLATIENTILIVIPVVDVHSEMFRPAI